MERQNEAECQESCSGDSRLRLIHHHPGYFRAQSDIFKNILVDSSILVAARTIAESAPGFLKWSHSPNTGSFVVEYEPGVLDIDLLLQKIANQVGLSGVTVDLHSVVHRKQLVNGVMDAVETVNEIVYHATDGRTDLRELLPATLVVTSIASFLLGDRKGRLPSWDSALYRSYRLFMQFHREEIKKRGKKKYKLNQNGVVQEKFKQKKKKKLGEISL